MSSAGDFKHAWSKAGHGAYGIHGPSRTVYLAVSSIKRFMHTTSTTLSATG